MLRLFVALLFLAALPAAAEAPPAAIYDSAPFNTGSLFSHVPCGSPFACNERLDDSAYLAKANICAHQRLGFPANMMTLFETGGVYENCTLPETYAPKGGNLGAPAQWPICCIEKKTEDLCQFKCYYYAGAGS